MTLQEYARGQESRQRERERKLLERFKLIEEPRAITLKLTNTAHRNLPTSVREWLKSAIEVVSEAVMYGTAVTKMKGSDGCWYGIRWKRGTKRIRYRKRYHAVLGPVAEDRFQGLATWYKEIEKQRDRPGRDLVEEDCVW